MTQVHSSGGAQAPFVTPKGKPKAASQSEKKIAVPSKATEAKSSSTGSGSGKHGTQVTIGQEALHAIAGTAEYLGEAALTGVEDVAKAAYYTVKGIGTGAVDLAEDVKGAITDGIQESVIGVKAAIGEVGAGITHVENALSDAWGVLTTGMTDATNLASTLGTDASTVVSNVGVAATDVGVGANAVLSGVSSAAKTAANYGSYVARAGGNFINELT